MGGYNEILESIVIYLIITFGGVAFLVAVIPIFYVLSQLWRFGHCVLTSVLWVVKGFSSCAKKILYRFRCLTNLIDSLTNRVQRLCPRTVPDIVVSTEEDFLRPHFVFLNRSRNLSDMSRLTIQTRETSDAAGLRPLLENCQRRLFYETMETPETSARNLYGGSVNDGSSDMVGGSDAESGGNGCADNDLRGK